MNTNDVHNIAETAAVVVVIIAVLYMVDNSAKAEARNKVEHAARMRLYEQTARLHGQQANPFKVFGPN